MTEIVHAMANDYISPFSLRSATLSDLNIFFLTVPQVLSHSLLFCPPQTDYPCSGMLGMVSGLITDDQITASSHTDRSWVPENSRLLTSRSGWTLLSHSQPYTDEWLQVDLGQEKLVRGLIIQGGKHRENKVFMKKFRLGYSNNGSDWKLVMEPNGIKPKVKRRSKTWPCSLL